ncbi:hypothetical protein LEP1GSC066_0472, partial [Leptospira sp. serovar Kenya str. Sh9]
PKPEKRNRLQKFVIKRKRRSSHESWLFDNLRAFEQILLFVHSCRNSYDSKVLGQVLRMIGIGVLSKDKVFLR